MRLPRSFAIGAASALVATCKAEDNYYYAAGNADAYYNAADNYYQAQNNNYYYQNQYASDGIDYWTDYAITPLSCITQNKVDVITFQIYEQGYKQCLNSPMGTFYTDVQTYIEGYLLQLQDNAENEGTDYTDPSAVQYLYCTQYTLNNGETYYLQLGCNDSNKEKLAVNIYSDSACTKRSVVDGSDDAVFDVSALKINFGECLGCVVWFDKNDADASYWKNHKNQAPLCHTAYEARQTCNGSCMKSAHVVHLSNWSSAEKFVLFCLFGFLGAGVANILKIKYLQKKDELLSKAETEEELNQEVANDPKFKWALIGGVAAIGFISFICVLARAKKATWILLFMTSAGLFGYLMKLTLETGYKPCGDTHYEDDSDDDDESKNSAKKGGEYTAPTPTDAGTSPAADAKPDSGVMA